MVIYEPVSPKKVSHSIAMALSENPVDVHCIVRQVPASIACKWNASGRIAENERNLCSLGHESCQNPEQWPRDLGMDRGESQRILPNPTKSFKFQLILKCFGLIPSKQNKKKTLRAKSFGF